MVLTQLCCFVHFYWSFALFFIFIFTACMLTQQAYRNSYEQGFYQLDIHILVFTFILLLINYESNNTKIINIIKLFLKLQGSADETMVLYFSSDFYPFSSYRVNIIDMENCQLLLIAFSWDKLRLFFFSQLEKIIYLEYFACILVSAILQD